MTSTSHAVVLGGARTPIGRYGGALSRIRTDDLLAFAMRAAVDRVGVNVDAVEEIAAGVVNVAHEGLGDIARWAALAGGFPDHVPAYTVNRSSRLKKRPKVYWNDAGLALHLGGEREPAGVHLETLVLADLHAWAALETRPTRASPTRAPSSSPPSCGLASGASSARCGPRSGWWRRRTPPSAARAPRSRA